MTVFIAAILTFLRSRVHLWMPLASINFFFLLRCVFVTKLPNANGFGEEDLSSWLERFHSMVPWPHVPGQNIMVTGSVCGRLFFTSLQEGSRKLETGSRGDYNLCYNI